MNYGKWKPMKKTDPTYGSTSNVHNSAVYGTSLLCTCGFYVPPQKEKHLALDKFREHIVTVKGLAYAHDAVAKATQAFQSESQPHVGPITKALDNAKSLGKDLAFGAIYGGGPMGSAKYLDVDYEATWEAPLEPLEGFVEVTEESLLDGDESYPQEAKEPFWDYAQFVKTKAQITKALAESKQETYQGQISQMGSFTQQKISFDPALLQHVFPEWSATVPPPADWLLDYAIVHYNVPAHAKMLSVMKDPYAQAIVLTVQWKTKPTVPDQSVWDKAVKMAKDYGAQPSFYEPGKYVVTEQLAANLVSEFGADSTVLSMFVVMKKDPYAEVPLVDALPKPMPGDW